MTNVQDNGGIEGARDIPTILFEILTSRGMKPEEMPGFLYPDYDRDLHDPLRLADMDKAVERILLAAQDREQVVVYGDYDIDGITASAVVIEGLRALGLEARSYIPDRFEEGYGINQAALERLQTEGVGLVISVDCGITSIAEALWAREHGLDLIVTDHHAVGPEIPNALAVINPKRSDDRYPFKDLAGVGVAFKLVQALQQAAGKPVSGQEKWLLDLVAMGTICDIVPLVGENRVLARYGLTVLRRTRRVGLQELARVGGVKLDRIGAYEVGYVLGPRMNAAGRLEHAAGSLELVMTNDRQRAQQIAEELDVLNQQRRADQAAIFEAADNMAHEFEQDKVLVLADGRWSHGVVGIVASKLAEKWQRPVLLAQVLGQTVKGSARSVPGFNMVEALRSQEQLLSRFGGHFFAAGYTLPFERLGELRRGLNDYYAQVDAGAVEVEEMLPDLRRTDLAGMTLEFLEILELLEPHGNANPKPLAMLEGLLVESVRPVGADGSHLSLKLRDTMGKSLSGIGFGLAKRYNELKVGDRVGVRGQIGRNEFQGRVSAQIIISDISF